MSMLQDVDTAVSVAFKVTIDDVSLGTFAKCEGLGAEVVLETREEGGNNNSVWQLPTRLRYPNIRLTRPLGKETKLISDWFSSMAGAYRRKTATIVAMTAQGREIARWGLLDVVPVRWTGPAFDSEHPAVATETVEIAHHGFIS